MYHVKYGDVLLFAFHSHVQQYRDFSHNEQQDSEAVICCQDLCQGGIASSFILSATSNLAVWYRPNEKADLHHMKGSHEWKLWGCQVLQQDVASGILQNSCP